jgi:hypothetical protein
MERLNKQLDPTQTGFEAEKFEWIYASASSGQGEAIQQIITIYQTKLAGMSSPGRPIGNFLFLGPAGSGKTRLVEATAESLVGDGRAVIKIDCAEFQHSHEIAKLIGSPPGYLGHRETHPLLSQEVLNQYHRKGRAESAPQSRVRRLRGGAPEFLNRIDNALIFKPFRVKKPVNPGMTGPVTSINAAAGVVYENVERRQCGRPNFRSCVINFVTWRKRFAHLRLRRRSRHGRRPPWRTRFEARRSALFPARTQKFDPDLHQFRSLACELLYTDVMTH